MPQFIAVASVTSPRFVQIHPRVFTRSLFFRLSTIFALIQLAYYIINFLITDLEVMVDTPIMEWLIAHR